MMNNLIGQKFERLTIIQRMDNNRWRQSKWLCKCDCGKTVIVIGSHLKSKNTKSCGCLQREIASACCRKFKLKHGHNKKGQTSKTYSVWSHMIQRCNNPNNKSYKDYGDRGINVCERWMKFENFLEDMGEAPRGLQIHREDNDGNYCLANCRWTTAKEQARNRRTNCLITHNGRTQLLIELCEEYDMSYGVIWDRIYKLEWSIKKALTTPVGKQGK